MPEYKGKQPERDLSTPPPLAVPLCFACLTATCRHRRCEGDIPRITYYEGTALCFDCAAATVDGLKAQHA